ncbi:MAG TPA: glycosyltransferase [Vicinamibacterales bacterium]|nr:glycosyltransferase [Vicinamibacterales bacterium]
MRVLLTSIGSFGDLNPYIGLGLALKERGHQPVLAVSKFYQQAVESAGLECRPVGPPGDPSDQETIRRIMDPIWGAQFLIRDLLMPTLDDAYEDLLHAARDADVLVSHPLTFAAPLVAETLQRPWAGAMLAPISFFSRMDPPVVLATPTASWVHRRWPHLSRMPIAVGRLVSRPWGKPLHAMRKRLRLRPCGHVLYEAQVSPHLNLALFSRVLAQPQPDWPVQTVVTGAVQYDAVQGGVSKELSAFQDAGPPPVVFTLGSAAVDVKIAPRFYEVSAAAAKALGVRAVLLAGRSAAKAPALASPDIFVTDWAPHSDVFPRAVAVVHHGGAGTLHTALAAGRPTIVVPFAHDQPDNASRLERLGISRTIFPQNYTIARVVKTLRSLLDDGGAAERARATAEIVRAERGGESAARAIERLAS